MSQEVRPFTVSATLVTARLVTGSVVSPVLIIPTGLEYIRVIIDVTNHTNSAITLALRVELSLDGGVTWPQFREVGRQGGDNATEASFEWDLPEPTNPLRNIRATLTLTGANRRLITSITVQAG